MKQRSQPLKNSSTIVKFAFSAVPYPVEITVLITDDQDVIVKHLEEYGYDAKNKDELPDAITTALVDLGMLTVFRAGHINYADVCHESYHLTAKILQFIGFEEWTEELDEPVTYLQGNIFACIEQGLRNAQVKVLPSAVSDIGLRALT